MKINIQFTIKISQGWVVPCWIGGPAQRGFHPLWQLPPSAPWRCTLGTKKGCRELKMLLVMFQKLVGSLLEKSTLVKPLQLVVETAKLTWKMVTTMVVSWYLFL